MPFDGTPRGAWVGHTWSHRKEHFYRALLESFAYELALTLDSIKTMYPEWDRSSDIILTGGGAKSSVWPGILADAVGCTFIRTGENDAALRGSVLLAEKAVGIISDISEAARSSDSPEDRILPNKQNFGIYSKCIGRYRTLLADIRSFCAQTY